MFNRKNRFEKELSKYSRIPITRGIKEGAEKYFTDTYLKALCIYSTYIY